MLEYLVHVGAELVELEFVLARHFGVERGNALVGTVETAIDGVEPGCRLFATQPACASLVLFVSLDQRFRGSTGRYPSRNAPFRPIQAGGGIRTNAELWQEVNGLNPLIQKPLGGAPTVVLCTVGISA
jgi:hypothetical protein